MSNRLMSLLLQKEAVKIDLEPFKQETRPLVKIWCVKMKDDAHQPDELNSHLTVINLVKAQINDRITSSLKQWIKNGAPDERDI